MLATDEDSKLFSGPLILQACRTPTAIGGSPVSYCLTKLNKAMSSETEENETNRTTKTEAKLAQLLRYNSLKKKRKVTFELKFKFK
jgi:hypothetical protein